MRRRIDLLQLHLLHQDAGAVIVERLLHPFLDRSLDGLPRAGENGLNIGAPDHVAHRTFTDRLHRAFARLHVEEEIADLVRLDLPQHREIDVDDVLVAGEHQGFFRQVAHGAAAAQIETDVDLVDAQRLRRERGLDRIGQVIIQPRLRFAHEFAEAEHHAKLIGLDPEKAGKAPQHDSGHRDQGETAAAEIAGQ